MKFRSLVTPLLAATILVGPLTATIVRAQDNAATKQQQQKGDTPLPPAVGGPFGGLAIGPLLMTLGGKYGAIVDPTHSNVQQLLQRDDVRSELFISSKVREMLDALNVKTQQEFQAKMMSTLLESFQGIQSVPAEERLDHVQQGLQTVQTTLDTFQGELDKRTEELLTLKQIERLHELDLQWRGPLAMADKKVAEALTLTPDQKAKVDDILKEYMTAQQTAMMTAVQEAQNNAAPGAGPFDQQAMIKSVTAAMQSPDMKKARKTADDKALALLTPDQQKKWKSMIGVKFSFRIIDTH